MKRLLLSFLLLTGLVFGASAATVGSLSYDESIVGNEVITDSLNDLEWLRWDVLIGLNYYADIVAAIAPGGAYEGWNIAGNYQAQQFTDAIFGSNDCTVSNNLICGSNASLRDVTGNNYTVSSSNYAFFLSDNGTGEQVGLIASSLNGSFSKSNEVGSIAYADSRTVNSATAISWLLYRDVKSKAVPESSPIVMFVIGLIGLSTVIRRKA